MAHASASTLLNRMLVRARFRHMIVLVKLSELGSMRRAAEAVSMTQPAVSQLVADLEQLLETELFFRHAKGVEPTEAAKELLPVAHRVLGALEDGAESVSNRLEQLGGVVRVSASPAAIGGMIQGKLDQFASKHPGIQVHFSQLSDSGPLGGIAEQSVDIICTREPTVIPEGWVFERCVDDSLIAVCGSRHPFAGKAEISNAELGQAKWLLNRVGSVARQRFEEIAEKNDWPLACRCHVIMHIPDLTKEMITTGKYLAILPHSVALPWLETGAVLKLNTDINAPLRPLGFLWEKSKAGKAPAAFAAHLHRQNP